MFEQVLGLVIFAPVLVLYPFVRNRSYITEAKYVDFSKVFR